VTVAYVCRLLPLTCVAPDIVEAILDGRQPKGLRLTEMLGNGPLGWRSSGGSYRARPLWTDLRKPEPPADCRPITVTFSQRRTSAELIEQGLGVLQASGSQQPRSPACSRRSSACLASARHEPRRKATAVTEPAAERAGKRRQMHLHQELDAIPYSWEVYPFR
jgi:hypothetical protein